MSAYRPSRRYRYRGYRSSGGQGQVIGVAVAAVVVLALASGKATAGHGTHAAAMGLGPGTASGGTLSCPALESLWESAGGPRSAAFLAAEIAMAESGGRQYATLHNANGSTDRGFWQINSVHGGLSTFDAAGNARAAVLISSNGTDWSPWVTYQAGAYAGKC